MRHFCWSETTGVIVADGAGVFVDVSNTFGVDNLVGSPVGNLVEVDVGGRVSVGVVLSGSVIAGDCVGIGVLIITESVREALADGGIRLVDALQAEIDMASTIAATSHIGNLIASLFLFRNMTAPVHFTSSY